MSSERVVNSFKNVGYGSLLQVLSLFLSFISRIVFIDLLGNDYLSLNGLFSNILSLLTFTDLGLGSAIIFSLYKPLADGDKKHVTILIRWYGRLYVKIVSLIFVLGVLIIPFLSMFIHDIPDVKENVIFIYILFLLNTIVSYLYSHKKSFLIASQKNYIVLTIYQGVKVLQILLQLLFLIKTHNYICFLLVMIICTIINSIVLNIYVNRRYDWIKNHDNLDVSVIDKTKLYKNVKSIVVFKLGSVLFNGTDNILISSMISTYYVGISSNYVMIIGAVRSIIASGMSGLSASIGNYNVKSAPSFNETIFNQLMFISFWVFGLISVLLYCLLNNTVEILFGKDYLLSDYESRFLVLSFYVFAVNSIPSSFRTAMGIFKETRYAPLYGGILNIILSIILGKIIGLAGIFLATSISLLLSFSVYDVYYVYKIGFKKSFKYYICVYILVSLYIYIVCRVIYFFSSFILVTSFLSLVIKLLFCFIVASFLFLIPSVINPVSIQVKNRLLSFWRK